MARIQVRDIATTYEEYGVSERPGSRSRVHGNRWSDARTESRELYAECGTGGVDLAAGVTVEDVLSDLDADRGR